MARKRRRRRRARRRAVPKRVPHRVSFKVPERPIAYSDVVFVVRRSGGAGGRKVGELRISQGGIEWFPRQTRKRCTKSWEQLERLLRC